MIRISYAKKRDYRDWRREYQDEISVTHYNICVILASSSNLICVRTLFTKTKDFCNVV